MIIKYMIQTWWVSNKIDRIEYNRETEHFLITSTGYRTKKMSDRVEHYDTWKEAKKRLIHIQAGKIAVLEDELDKKRKILAKILDMKDETKATKEKEGQTTS